MNYLPVLIAASLALQTSGSEEPLPGDLPPARTASERVEKAPEGLLDAAEDQTAVRGRESIKLDLRLVGRRVAASGSGRWSLALVEVQARDESADAKLPSTPVLVNLSEGQSTDVTLESGAGSTTTALKVLEITSRSVVIEDQQRGEKYTLH